MTTDNDTITSETPGAPTAPEETFAELDLEGVGFSLEGEAPAPAPAPAKEIPTAPATPVVEDGRRKGGDLRKALHEERGKVKFYRDLAESLRQQQHRAPPLNLSGRVPRIGQAEIAKIREEAEKAVGFGEPVARVLEVFDRKIPEVVAAIERGLREQEIQRQEQRFVRTHRDYYETLTRAGIYQAVAINPATGHANDPRIAKSIFENDEGDDPPEAAYFLAKALLGEEVVDGAASHAESVGPGGPLSPPSPTPPPIPAPQIPPPPSTPSAADVAAEAERRGARQVAERVIANESKPRGIHMLRTAGAPPKVELNEALRRHLDREMDRDPTAVMTFFAKNPTVRTWWES